MISYFCARTVVWGPIDRYDVFIRQRFGAAALARGGSGRHREFAAHAALHVDPSEPVLDVELLPGDIPLHSAGFPHDGVSLEPSMSFSVGFPGQVGLPMLGSLADYLIDQELGSDLLTDPKRPVHHNQGYIDATDFARIRAHIQRCSDNDTLMADFAGSFLSRRSAHWTLQGTG